MKYYTLAEHHTFCVESGIPNGAVWKQVSNLAWMPEGIYHDPTNAFSPKHKAKRKKYSKKRYSTPEGKAWQKDYQKNRYSTPEYRAWRKEYDRKYRSTEYKARKKEYDKRRWRNKK